MLPIPLLNSVLLLGVCVSAAVLFLFSPIKEIEKPLPPLPKKIELPPSPLKVQPSSFERIGEGPLALEWHTPAIELPDLREEIIYYGKNGRPDVKEGRQLFHISLKTSNVSKSAEASEKTYLLYNKGIYSFSPENRPTSLWLEMTPSDASNHEYLNVIVSMRGEDGAILSSPEACHLFTLKASEMKNNMSSGWELPGGIRVDGSLLARQRARFIGPDAFLERHGGEEYAGSIGRDRIDFIENESLYSCFVKEGDFLIWKEGKWHTPLESDDTTHYPLLVLKKVEEKILLFDLWESQGKGKLQLTLVKIKMHEGMPEISHEFKFVGAKTWSQFVVECRGKRIVLRPGDWLLLGKEGWQKIESVNEIDDYVNQTLMGPLFVLDKMIKKEGRSLLVGHLFNTTRTEAKEIELGSQEPKGTVKP